MSKRFLMLLVVVPAISFYSCSKFEFSPYQDESQDQPRDLNAKNYSELQVNEPLGDDTVTILFTGDSQRYYESLEALVLKTNTLAGIDMFILAGDISDFGLLREQIWVAGILDRLNVPFFCVIGNHDLATTGPLIFEGIFGPRNFSIMYKDHKLLFHDTNGREYNFDGGIPDMGWLSGQLADAASQWLIGVSHVPPFNEDFDEQLESSYAQLLESTPGFILSLSGHLHNGFDGYPYGSVRYICSSSTGTDRALLIKIINGNILTESVYY